MDLSPLAKRGGFMVYGIDKSFNLKLHLYCIFKYKITIHYIKTLIHAKRRVLERPYIRLIWLLKIYHHKR